MKKLILTESELIGLIQKIISEEQLTDLDEYELIHLLKKQDQRAQTELYNRYLDRIKRFILSKTQKLNPDDLEEIALETLEKAMRKIDDFRGESTLATWIFRIAYRNLLTFVKSQESVKRKSEKYVDPLVMTQTQKHHTSTSINDTQKIFEKFLDTLNEKERRIMKLRAQGMSNMEIAQNADSTEGTIKWYMSNLMKRFKDFMEKYK